MATDGESTPHKDTFQAARRRPSRRLSPPRWVTITAVLCLATIVGVQLAAAATDFAIMNVVTLIAGFIGVTTLVVWFTRYSGFTKTVRMATLWSLVGAIGIAAAVLEIDEVNGWLVPSFKFRWSKRPDQKLGRPQVTAQPPVAANTQRKEKENDLESAILALDQVHGWLTPSFQFRWLADEDLKTLQKPATDDHDPVLPSETTANDFPQFLGPNRNASIEGVQLARDWQRNPPQQLWKKKIGAGWSAFSAVGGYAYTLEQRGPEEMVVCYEIESGKTAWFHAIQARHSTTLGGIGPRSTPTVHEGKVYALGATGVLHCLDAATGKPAWPSKNLLEMFGVPAGKDGRGVSWGRSASPLIVDDLVIVPAGGPAKGPHVSLVAFDKKSGEKIWTGGGQQISYSSPSLATIDGVRQIVIVNESTVSGHDIKTGKELWRHPWPGSSTANASVSQTVALPGNRLLLSKGYGQGAALLKLARGDNDRWSIEVLWESSRVLKTKFTNVAVRDGYAYGLSDGILECIDLADGKRKWKRGRYGPGQILRVGDLILVQAESGDVALVEATPQRHSELARFAALEGMTWNNPCLYGDLLLVRNGAEAACYRLPLQK